MNSFADATHRRKKQRRFLRKGISGSDDAMKACHTKMRFNDELQAIAYVTHENESGRTRLYCYRCRFCGGWHLSTVRSPSDVRRMLRTFQSKGSTDVR